ncbi:hypothetical protein ACFO4P_17000 [Epilithonimonas pallida]|uniref:Uncharacterized protein n=1 Tax=Epilithonimonas pallida TaxID=373671 RepID=A0ABY1R3X9_9FLAO|nr:hypothetical protein [Epilithonimonas pallida]SMP94683.1 hypothetical protein SAMN05421679_10686 [Epilithonimonas pallida]
MIRLNNDIITDTNKVPLGLYTLPALEFDVRFTAFPPSKRAPTDQYYGTLIFTNSGNNIIYIDFGDGSSVFTQSFTGNWSWVTSNGPLKTYPNSNSKIVKIWFEYPWKITSIVSDYMYFYGDFIGNIGLYKLDTLDLGQMNFATLNSFKGGIYTNFKLQATGNTITALPDSISRSRINTLLLGGSTFNFSNGTTNKLENLINIQGLVSFSINGATKSTTTFPSNLKDCSMLRNLDVTGSTTIPDNIGKCAQITSLSLGKQVALVTGGSNGGCNMTSWGYGIGEMSNLVNLYSEGIIGSTTFPTTQVIGLELNAKLKNLYLGSVFGTVSEVDTFIDNLYNQITTNQTPGTITTVPLRGITLSLRNFGGAYTKYTPRPSGTFQAPTDFVLNSANGTPASPLEKLYVIAKNYKWSITITGTAGGTTTQTLIP